MTVQDRREIVLAFLSEHNLALKPIDIYRNMRLHYRITFGAETVRRILDELVELGYARRVDPERLEDRELVDLPEGKGRGAYVVTDEGKDVSSGVTGFEE